nr:hypothetical protein [uncultured Faecalimonas sp.]
MITVTLDTVKFQLKEIHDFSWLQEFGKIFAVFDQNDSGNISFGVARGTKKFFIKVAGINTSESIRTKNEAILALKSAMSVYEAIRHPHLIELVKHGSLDDLYISVFKWADGDCLFDHWNFENYNKNPHLIPPAKRFRQLPLKKRLAAAEVLFSFLNTVSESGYIAVDFYAGSIMYDFQTDKTTICDIDLFRKRPAINDMGEDYWGTKRLKAPEEYCYGAVIDESTNVYTLGALLFDSFFGHYTDEEVYTRYEQNAFSPCSLDQWELGKSCYDVACKAVLPERSKRYSSISSFYKDWKQALFETERNI